MEDATITNLEVSKEITLKERFPTVVDTDDLVWELGRKEVDRLNKEKLLETLLKKSKEVQNLITQSQQELIKVKDESKALRESNLLYEKNNRVISDTLTQVRHNLDNETKEKEKYKNDLIVQATKLDTMAIELNTIKTNFSNLKKEKEKYGADLAFAVVRADTLAEEVVTLKNELIVLKAAFENTNKELLYSKEESANLNVTIGALTIELENIAKKPKTIRKKQGLVNV